MIKLYKHQKEALGKALLGNLALFHDCGCGKTATMLKLILQMKIAGIKPVLVVCPLSIIDAAWIEDCKKFTPQLSIVSLWSKKPKERKKRLDEDHDIYVANYETFKYLFNYLEDKDFKAIIVDESSKMKNPTSQITRALLATSGLSMRARKGTKYKAFNNPIRFRYALSGTPAPNDESEYWAQIVFLSHDIFNTNFYVFRARYFYSVPIGAVCKIWKFKKDMADEFNEKLSRISHVVTKEDAIDLPGKVTEIRDVILSDKEAKAYNDLKKDLVLRFSNETILASTALTEVMKLRQITSGFIYGENETHQIGSSKLNELKQLLDEIGRHQVIIWCNFKYEIEMLLREFVGDCAGLYSATKDRASTIVGFKNNQFKYLIANPQSAAHGLTFTNCSYAIYYSQNYSYEYQKQSEDRIYRIGQSKKCTYYHLIAKNTIDKLIYNAVSKKADLSNKVLEFLKEKK